MDAFSLLEILLSILTFFVVVVTLVMAMRLSKFFKGGAFMKIWKTLYTVPFFMGLAEVSWLLEATMLGALAHLAACLAFLYSLYLFYQTWTKMGR